MASTDKEELVELIAKAEIKAAHWIAHASFSHDAPLSDNLKHVDRELAKLRAWIQTDW